MPFERGFKTRCENISESIRRDLGLNPSAPLPMEPLATYLIVQLFEPTDVSGISDASLQTLLVDHSNEWSALNVSKNGTSIVIYNPANSVRRRSSDLAHESSHLILRHAPSTLMFALDGTWTLRSFNAQQEDEAGCPAACCSHGQRCTRSPSGDWTLNQQRSCTE
jgi:hypothetical protein